MCGGHKYVVLPHALRIAELGWKDALRRDPHPSHAHLAQTLAWFSRAECGLGVTTNMHIDLDYDAVLRETPENVTPAHDGMRIELI